jgi:hypothetical protein
MNVFYGIPEGAQPKVFVFPDNKSEGFSLFATRGADLSYEGLKWKKKVVKEFLNGKRISRKQAIEIVGEKAVKSIE